MIMEVAADFDGSFQLPVCFLHSDISDTIIHLSTIRWEFFWSLVFVCFYFVLCVQFP